MLYRGYAKKGFRTVELSLLSIVCISSYAKLMPKIIEKYLDKKQ